MLLHRPLSALILTVLLSGALLTGCKQKTESVSEPPPANPPPAVAAAPTNPRIVAAADECFASFVNKSLALTDSIKTFIASSNKKNQQSAQTQWLDTHAQWHRCRFYLAYFDNRLLLASAKKIHNTSIEPGYIDAVDGYPQSGLINDVNVPIMADSIREQHQRYSAAEIALGLNAIEFMLWQRTVADYNANAKLSAEQIESGWQAADLAQTRRRIYLPLLGELLIEDAETVQQQFADERDSLRGNRHLTNLVTQQLLSMLKHRELITEASWQIAALQEYQHWLLDDDPELIASDRKEAIKEAFDGLYMALVAEPPADLRAPTIALLKALDE